MLTAGAGRLGVTVEAVGRGSGPEWMVCMVGTGSGERMVGAGAMPFAGPKPPSWNRGLDCPMAVLGATFLPRKSDESVHPGLRVPSRDVGSPGHEVPWPGLSTCHPPHGAPVTATRKGEAASCVCFCGRHGGQVPTGWAAVEPMLSPKCQHLPGSGARGGPGSSLWAYHPPNCHQRLSPAPTPREALGDPLWVLSFLPSSRAVSQQRGGDVLVARGCCATRAPSPPSDVAPGLAVDDHAHHSECQGHQEQHRHQHARQEAPGCCGEHETRCQWAVGVERADRGLPGAASNWSPGPSPAAAYPSEDPAPVGRRWGSWLEALP